MLPGNDGRLRFDRAGLSVFIGGFFHYDDI
jgi:hypothetical protein